jgi:hypothetical protein
MFPATTARRMAYEATSYVVYLPHRPVVLRVGRLPPVLPWGAARGAVFVTAWNPLGRAGARADNVRAGRRLRAALVRAGLRAAAGEGRGDRGDWPAERSLLVFGLARGPAAALGRRWRQNAVLWVARGLPVRLLPLR